MLSKENLSTELTLKLKNSISSSETCLPEDLLEPLDLPVSTPLISLELDWESMSENLKNKDNTKD